MLDFLSLSGVGLQGAGTAAVFSTTFLWLETLMPVTNAIGAAYTVAWNVAIQVENPFVLLIIRLETLTLLQVYSLYIGQNIVSSPAVFLYAMSFTVTCCVLNFALANILAIIVQRDSHK